MFVIDSADEDDAPALPGDRARRAAHPPLQRGPLPARRLLRLRAQGAGLRDPGGDRLPALLPRPAAALPQPALHGRHPGAEALRPRRRSPRDRARAGQHRRDEPPLAPRRAAGRSWSRERSAGRERRASSSVEQPRPDLVDGAGDIEALGDCLYPAEREAADGQGPEGREVGVDEAEGAKGATSGATPSTTRPDGVDLAREASTSSVRLSRADPQLLARRRGRRPWPRRRGGGRRSPRPRPGRRQVVDLRAGERDRAGVQEADFVAGAARQRGGERLAAPTSAAAASRSGRGGVATAVSPLGSIESTGPMCLDRRRGSRALSRPARRGRNDRQFGLNSPETETRPSSTATSRSATRPPRG